MLCIVEAMKLMNEIEADCAGTILEILAEDVPDHMLAAGELRVQHRQSSLEELGQLADTVRLLAERYPEARLAAMDAKWWMIAQFDSVVVSMPDGASASWYRRDQDEFTDLLRRTVEIHQRLHREWPRLAREYRQALSDITSPARSTASPASAAPWAPSRNS